MRPLLLACLCTSLALCSAASAGGAGSAATASAPTAPFGTPRPALSASAVRPGQVWELAGTTAGGQRVSRLLTLSSAAPDWDNGWKFRADQGNFSFTPATRLTLATHVAGLMEEGKPALFCFGFIDQATPPASARTGRGFLLSGTFDQLNAELKKLDLIPSGTPDPHTAEEFTALVRGVGVNAGACTLTRR